MGKYVWFVANNKDILWLRWINSVYLHNTDWWSYKVANQVRWYWGCLVKLKDQFKDALNGHMVLQHKYNVSQGYNLFCPTQTKAQWSKQVWGMLNTPKHSFLLWLAIQQELKIKDRLLKMGIIKEQTCLLCSTQNESTAYLFFECTVSQHCLEDIKAWLHWNTSSNTMSNLIRWIGRAKISSYRKLVLAAAIASLVYHLWRMRNSFLWEKEQQDTTKLCKEIKAGVIQRIKLFWPKKDQE
ncbi:uncharacterized protein LOC133034303 [Cannabis sativa]|uniref:uncharacterized protein LOC133034303 n=1 Tax=Cannabis sativa TaxID=3483 RepID=UPI0029CA9370|nr:uncharacterized protein LOC133034303 [Cannabis sativa]